MFPITFLHVLMFNVMMRYLCEGVCGLSTNVHNISPCFCDYGTIFRGAFVQQGKQSGLRRDKQQSSDQKHDSGGEKHEFAAGITKHATWKKMSHFRDDTDPSSDSSSVSGLYLHVISCSAISCFLSSWLSEISVKIQFELVWFCQSKLLNKLKMFNSLPLLTDVQWCLA